jgi:hypothetical protein
MTPEFDTCVIGAGPAGLASALRLARHGLSVALVESGGERFDQATQALSDAIVETPDAQAPMADAVQRGLGGTSAIWGGRCVPLDALDFEHRAHVPHSGWPICAADLAPYMAEATAFLGAGDAAFEVAACRRLATASQPLARGLGADAEVLANTLERWSSGPDAWVTHGASVRKEIRIDLLSGWTCVGLEQGGMDAPVRAALLARREGSGMATQVVKARTYVLACGGVESTRLVLHAMRGEKGLRLSHPELVGKFYMGHPSGKLADIQFGAAPQETLYGFERDGPVYVRRRLTLAPQLLQQAKLLNIAFWLDNPPIHDAAHGSGVLSAAYLALSAPGVGALLAPTAIRKRAVGEPPHTRWPHLRNCLASPLQTLRFCADFLPARYLRKPRVPGFFTHSPANRYALHFHGEQVPRRDSEITLDDAQDSLGMPRARIALRWSDQDVDSILAAHEALGRGVQRIGAAALHWRYPESHRRQAVLDQAVDGFHQLGTLRMAATPQTGVTDHHGRLFGTPNLYAATSAIFPTSGQANPTLSLLAMVLRQADEVAHTARRMP